MGAVCIAVCIEVQGPALTCTLSGCRLVAQVVEAVGKFSAGRQAKICGHSTFQAAGDRAGKAAGRLLSGRFITTCSHLMILRMANMPAKYGGERYAYAWLMAAGERAISMS